MSIGKHIGSTFLTRIFSIVLSVGTSIFTARMLGVEGKGEYSIFLATLNLSVLVLGLGLQPAITYHSARRDIEPQKIFFTLLFYSGIVSLLFFGVMHLTHRYTGTVIFLHKNNNSIGFEIILAFSLFMMLIMNNIKAIFSSQKMFGILNRFQIISVATGLTIYGILFLGNKKWWIVPIWLVFFTHGTILLLNFCINNWTFFKKFVEGKRIEIMNRSERKLLFSFARTAYFGSIAQFLNYRIDFWFVDFFAGTHELGLYSLAANLVQMIWILPQSIAQVFLPHIASGSKAIIPNLLATARISVFVSACFAILAYFFIEFILVKMYGEAFRGAAPVVDVLLLGIVPFSLSIIYASYFNGIGRNDLNFKSAIVGLVATITLDILLIPNFGKIGAAVASGCSYSLSTFFILYHVGRLTSSSLTEMIFLRKTDFQLLIEKTKFSKRIKKYAYFR